MTGDGGADGELNGQVLPDDGVVDLADRLTEYMTEIELGGLPDIIGQVLDDFLEQCGGMPDDLRDPRAFEQITNNQLAMTLAYQLGRLAGRSPQIVQRLLQQAAERWKARPVAEGIEVSDADMQRPKELVYPRLRRLEYPEAEEG